MSFSSIVSALLDAQRQGLRPDCPECGRLYAEKEHPISGEVIRLRVGCPHELEARDRQDQAQSRNASYTRWMAFNAALLPALPSAVRLDDLEPTPAIAGAKRRVSAYLQNIERVINLGQGLYLHGNPGTGKTAMACAIVADLSERYFTACFLTAGQLIDGYKSRDVAQFREMVQSVGFLIIDDIGSEGVTDYSASKLFEGINDRYASKKPIIITSNFSPTALCSRYSRQLTAKGMSSDDASMSVRRLLSRIAERCESVEFAGDDYRLRRRGWALLSGAGS